MDLRRLSELASRVRLPRRTVRLRLTFVYGCLFLLTGAGLLAITYALVNNKLSTPIRTSGGSLPPTAGSGIVLGSAPASFHAQQAADLHELLVQSGIALVITAAASVGLGWLVAGRVLRPIQAMTATTRRISERSLHERLALTGPRDDVTDLGDTIDRLLARLEAAFDSQRSFVANASHELRTPLMVTQTVLQVALADPAITLDSLKGACAEVIETGKEQAQLIDALLTLARSQRGLEHQEPFDLAAVASDALDGTRAAAAANALTVEAALDPAPLRGDPRLVRTLVSNLLDNAIRYNQPGGRVAIVTTTDAGHSLLRVTNTGPLIPDDEVDRLLQPFQRLESHHSNDRGGLGLGLSIAAAIATAHGADLTVQPKNTGGLDIQVRFPRPGTTTNTGN
jgi:signal transduction histidine kinase